jgi:hypothetical protein
MEEVTWVIQLVAVWNIAQLLSYRREPEADCLDADRRPQVNT